MTNSCKICSECKPRFHKPPEATLIKATQTFEKLDLDFKGPLPSNNKNIYFLQIIDEYSKYPFVYPCSDMKTETVISKLCDLFAIFGMPAYIHSDRGSSFMSKELKAFLMSRGIATSRTTPYNPEGNGLVESSNGTIWRSVTMALRSKGLPQSCWQLVMPDVLHSIRSLLCTSTNQTPHERMFSFPRRSGTGVSIPTWLTIPGPVLLRKFVRRSKQDPLVNEVELIQANGNYAHIRYPNGREDTVSVRHLAPTGDSCRSETPIPDLPDLHQSQDQLPSSVGVGNRINDQEQVALRMPVESGIMVTDQIDLPVQTSTEVTLLPTKVSKDTTPFTPRVSSRTTKGKPAERLNL